MPEDRLQKYQSLIEDLKLDLGDPAFDRIFKQRTADLSKPDQFLLKMEMSRLSQPVARFIDLRGQVAGQVKPYEYEGKQHFMDDLAIEVFEREVAKHGGYTLAVYESVMNTDNNYKVMKKQALAREEEVEKDAVNHNYTKLVRFASYESRSEERMNYSIKITVELAKNRPKFSASTSDISLSGAKIKLPTNQQVDPGQIISIRLVGLEQDFELGLKEGIQYEVVAVEPGTIEYNQVRLKRTFIEKNQGFDDFLNSFIHGNKRRYKINLDNTLDAVVCKGYEQYYLPRVCSLFVFISEKQKQLYPSMVLTNENNAYINYYFEDERKQSGLYSVFNQKRMQRLLALSGAVKEAICHVFTHSSQGRMYFYSAFDFELEEMQQLNDLFFAFGSQKDSWRTFKVQLMPSHHEDAFIPLSLPASAGKNVEKLNKRPTPRVQGFIQDVKYLMLLTDISNPTITERFQRLSYEQSLVNQLKKFGHGKSATPPPLEVVALEYVNLRAHRRYLYKTNVVVHIDGQGTFNCITRDFSVMGLQIECGQEMPLNKGDSIHLDLVDLQKLTKQHNLTNLRYEVMMVNKAKTIINLKVQKIGQLDHSAMGFFKALIESNKDKLVACDEAPKVPGLSLALRNMVTKSVCQFPLYLHKETSHNAVGAIGQGLYPTSLHHLLHSFSDNDDNTLDAKAVFPERFVEEKLTEILKAKSRQDKPLKYLVFIKFDPNQTNQHEAVNAQVIAHEDSIDSLYLYAKKALRNDLLFVYQLYVSKTGRPDMDYLANELRYVSHYAIHKAKDLEEALWSVTGVCDLIDVTDYVVRNMGFDLPLVTKMEEQKKRWLEANFKH
ncbi:PilZ domain-containing protein [Pseudoalteromonas piscicida]|uniref:PilZ domain-containing protein n=1 Tax=Pseudoalteromonas piscicida TaxID=43662 RepID=UPI000E35A6E9|nr:PilZ domain-containing protein [Pseudoalteromonas piscicida]AXQ98808.1 PilZ domain-containing protein [Pseudoalteromonas piscicida]